MDRRRASAALSLLLALCASCGRRVSTPDVSPPGTDAPASGDSPTPCTEIGCTNGLEITLEHQGRWPAGRYELDLDLDGTTVSCAASLPFANGCDGSPYVRCTPAGLVAVGESGCALPPLEHSLTDLSIPSAPARVRVSIRRDGQAIADANLSPSYRTVQPNGPDCGPTCRNARETVTVR